MLPRRATPDVTTVSSAAIDRAMARIDDDLIVRPGPGGTAASAARGHE